MPEPSGSISSLSGPALEPNKMSDTAIQETVNEAAEFSVVPELCIACDACCQDFPEVFYMGDDLKAHALDDQLSTLYNARVVVDVCPTEAILFSGELPPAEDLANLEDVPGWEAEWALWRGVEEDQLERDGPGQQCWNMAARHIKRGRHTVGWC